MSKILSNNFKLYNAPRFENTAKAIPPNASCPSGKIVVVIGQPRDKIKILHRPIYNSSGDIDTNSETSEEFFPLGSPTRALGTDNQIVRLKDGSLLAHKDSYIWDDISSNPPAWFNEIVDGGGGPRKGQRGCLLFARSTDCGSSWKFHALIDFATFLDGNYGYPQKHWEPTKKYWIGGPDRTELYACPFTGFIYLTTRVKGGPYEKDNTHTPLRDTMLLLYSKNGGTTWEVIKKDLPSWSPAVMTSTPNGRLFLFQCIPSQPTIYFSIAPASTSSKPEISPGYPVYYKDNGTDVPANGDDKNELSKGWNIAISRISLGGGSSKVRIAYPTTLTPDGRQQVRIVRIDVQNPLEAPIVTPVTTIQAEKPIDYSVLYFNFIEPDYISMPLGVRSNTSLGFWIESPGTGLTIKQFAAKYMLFEGDDYVSDPNYLSVKDGQPRIWSGTQPVGDYIVGAFFWKDNNLNYLAHWSEQDGLKANIVSVPHKQAQQLVRGWLLEHFKQKDNIMAGDGYHLASMQRYDIGGGQIRYGGIFNRSDLKQEIVYGSSLNDFKNKNNEMENKGFRLASMQPYSIGGGQIRYDGIWNPGDLKQEMVYGSTLDDFKKKYNELEGKGFRLASTQRYDIGGGQILYDGIWNPSDLKQETVYGRTLDDFKKKHNEMTGKGFRLASMQPHNIGGGQIRYDGIWNAINSQQAFLFGWLGEHFHTRHRQLYMKGYRLSIMQAYDIGNAQIRYDAVWNLT